VSAMSEIADAANLVLNLCLQRNLKVSTAESCTGGLIAAALTEIAGSSAVFDRGFVTYSNEAKMDLLDVNEATLQAYGAVSEETASEMAEGALSHSLADIAVSVTGIAGPSGATPGKPVGLVWFGLAKKGSKTKTVRHIFAGDRSTVRQSALRTALSLLADGADQP